MSATDMSDVPSLVMMHVVIMLTATRETTHAIVTKDTLVIQRSAVNFLVEENVRPLHIATVIPTRVNARRDLLVTLMLDVANHATTNVERTRSATATTSANAIQDSSGIHMRAVIVHVEVNARPMHTVMNTPTLASVTKDISVTH
ncbi:uncharacterized protein LOC110457114 [Mizuhopecten yessoensis]|uniref:uncharacterized protein LOC110457114 n=1 Tax=Mizuhopecten yessoensis TaxID=6573 RepID=UPI000B45DC81|nr:uncharacterized protein LOC110457114 [Mizuhopecten yessoensis]